MVMGGEGWWRSSVLPVAAFIDLDWERGGWSNFEEC